MADNETSHLMWIIIVLAVASMVFMGLKAAFPNLISATMDKIAQGVGGIDTSGDYDHEEEEGKDPEPPKPAPTLVAPEDLMATTSGPGEKDAKVGLPTVLKDSELKDVTVSYEITKGSEKGFKPDALGAGDYVVTYSADGYKSVTQKIKVKDGEAKTLVAPEDVSLETSGYKKADAKYTIPKSIVNNTGAAVTGFSTKVVDGSGKAADLSKLSKGSYVVTYSMAKYDSVTQKITVKDKVSTPYDISIVVGGRGAKLYGSADPNVPVEISLTGQGKTKSVTVTADAEGNFSIDPKEFDPVTSGSGDWAYENRQLIKLRSNYGDNIYSNWVNCPK